MKSQSVGGGIGSGGYPPRTVYVTAKDDEYDYVMPAAYHDKEDKLGSSAAQFEPPCPCGQQFIGGLFGFFLGYFGLLFTGNFYVALVFSSGGVAFGSLGSNVYDLSTIDKSEFALFCVMCIVVSLLLTNIQFLVEADLAGIFCISFVVSSAINSIKSFLSVAQVFQKLPKELTRVCNV